MKYASIDIGTNTLRLLIAEPDGAKLKPLIYKRAITRLGGSYTEEGGIDKLSAKRTVDALVDFKKIISENKITEVTAVATSVVRRAANRQWFLDEVKKKAGIEISVISGDEEARLSLLGVLSVIEDKSEKQVVIDIGGGSTEFIFTTGLEMHGAWSMEMGVVHLTENHLKSDPPKKTELQALEKEIERVISELKGLMLRGGIYPEDYSSRRGATFIGTAGTITTLAAMDQNLEVYDRDRINNYRLSKKRIQEIYEYLVSLTIKERSEVLTLEKGREDLIIPGSAITLFVMDSFGFDEIKVSDAGLLEGIILNRIDRIKTV
ncbi:MAG: Ppx/GppA family phosphatase [Deltaproteobacteria bacterium]|nr:Ppx/GppA family phosphatase [Deltaproteobacteria bacterium]